MQVMLFRQPSRPVPGPPPLIGDRDQPNTILFVEISQSKWKPVNWTESDAVFVLGRVKVRVVLYPSGGGLELGKEFAAETFPLLLVPADRAAKLVLGVGVNCEGLHG